MKIEVKGLFAISFVLAMAGNAPAETRGAAGDEPFQPTVESLQSYQCPEWFRDAKFGIYCHWNAQSSVEGPNGWYARNMYIEGHEVYEHHLKTLGNATSTLFSADGLDQRLIC